MDESVAAKTEKTIKISAKADYCGKMVFSLKKVQVSDYLHLFARKVRVRSQINVNVLPDIHTFPVEVSMKTRNFPVEGDEYEKERSGDDPSEIFQIREFRPGDRMQQIHWKSSARSGEPHFVAWYDEKEGQIRRHAVKKEQDLYEMLDLLMRDSFYKQEYDVKAAYFSSYPEGTYSTVLILDKEGNLQRDEEDTVTFGEEELKESLSGFVLEV